jgi:D-arabinose 1-dehydrogenase-like Zn-dependent alcohol dehydrogenase
LADAPPDIFGDATCIAAEPASIPHIDVLCMACNSAACDFKPVTMQRRTLGPRDVLIEMKYCGVCHSDLHHAADHNMGETRYPCVPGHELAGVVIAAGAECEKLQVGSRVGVGCLVDACLECSACRAGEENNCKRSVSTYGARDKGSGRAATPCGYTLGGYTDRHVCDERFCVVIPDGYPLECAGPVMCAGITMYDPLVRLGAKAGTRVGIVGLGGLGVMGVKIAKAMGCVVTAFSRRPSKRGLAEHAGADAFVLSTERAQLKGAGPLDIVLNTVPVYHPYDAYSRMLASGGRHAILGLHKGMVAAWILRHATGERTRLTMSAIGGIRNTQAVIDLCAEHGIRPEVEVVPVDRLNDVYKVLDAGNPDGKRHVLDIAGTLRAERETNIDCGAPPDLSDVEGALAIGGGLCELLRLVCCCCCTRAIV